MKTITVKKITVEKIMTYGPRWVYSECRVKEIIGDGKTIAEYCDLPTSLFDFPADKFWVLAECDILSDRLLHKIAIRAAELVLPIYESQFPGDDRPRNAIEIKKLWLIGWATDDELDDARSAAVHIVGAVGEAARQAIISATRIDKCYPAAKAAQDAAWEAWNSGTIAECEDIYEDLFVFIKKNAGESK